MPCRVSFLALVNAYKRLRDGILFFHEPEFEMSLVIFALVINPFLSAMCRDPGIPRNGIRIGDDFGDGQMVAYSNFDLFGSSTSFCIAGEWNSTRPACKGVYVVMKYS